MGRISLIFHAEGGDEAEVIWQRGDAVGVGFGIGYAVPNEGDVEVEVFVDFEFHGG